MAAPTVAPVAPAADSTTSPLTLRDGGPLMAVAPEAHAARQDPAACWWPRLEAGAAAANAAAGAGIARAPEADEGGDDASAARRAEAAGLPEIAARRYLAAAASALGSGQYAAALDGAERALTSIEGMTVPDAPWLAASAWLTIGQCRWLTGGADAGSLDGALEALERAREHAASGRYPELQAAIASMIANVCYDIGTPVALERALVEITLGSELWLDAGRPIDAARLLNDEAAIWVKRGNPVRANQLLLRSRDVFQAIAHDDPVARLELLETEHLLARSMLQSSAQPGRDGDLGRLGIEHAMIAEAGYRELNRPRQLGRVWETLGRLQLRLGRLDEATDWLERALQLQRETGDTIGSARSAGALCDVAAAAHDYPRALARLAESVAFNTEKGAAAGLQYNLMSLRQLEATMPGLLVEQAGALGQRLVRALSIH
jgi:tetratricopeptide (TPR) repeat protein